MDAANEQILRQPKKLPQLQIQSHILNSKDKDLDSFLKLLDIDDFSLRGYDSYPKLVNETKLSTGLS